MVSQTLFSSATEEWETPQRLFDDLNEEFHFNWDLAATKSNAKCEYFYTKDDDALNQNWPTNIGYCWLNPPYSNLEKILQEKSTPK